MTYDAAGVERAVRDLLVAIGEDPSREGLIDTPARMSRAWAEIVGGLEEDPSVHLETHFQVEHEEMVLVRDIDFYSVCEHHLLPFYGKAHVAYIPKKYITGLSKIPRVVDIFARRLQIQERMTMQIKDCIQRLSLIHI